MERRTIYKTEDGSTSFIDHYIGETFHSHFGAISESQFIFIDSALNFSRLNKKVNILEIGWGTGLNFLLTLQWQKAEIIEVRYFAIEKYPLKPEEFNNLNYDKHIPYLNKEIISQFHNQKWNEECEISNGFFLHKSSQDIIDLHLKTNYFDIVFFDAFSPDKQPELWSESVFKKIFIAMKPDGILTTYSVKGDVRRALKSVGFEVNKIPGPKGKREITRAIKR